MKNSQQKSLHSNVTSIFNNFVFRLGVGLTSVSVISLSAHRLTERLSFGAGYSSTSQCTRTSHILLQLARRWVSASPSFSLSPLRLLLSMRWREKSRLAHTHTRRQKSMLLNAMNELRLARPYQQSSIEFKFVFGRALVAARYRSSLVIAYYRSFADTDAREFNLSQCHWNTDRRFRPNNDTKMINLLECDAWHE